MNEDEYRKAARGPVSETKPIKSLDDLSVSDWLAVEQTARVQAAIEVFGRAIANYIRHPDRPAEDQARAFSDHLQLQEDLAEQHRRSICESLRRRA